MDRKPLVLDSSANLEQLQSQDDLDIPLRERVELLEVQLNTLAQYLLAQGFELPEDLTENL